MNNYLKLMRVKHWLKNGLVFLPVFFSLNILNTNKMYFTVLAFIIFSFVSSIIYIINDINDIENDKNHPVKKNRPLASGKISIKQSILVIIFLILISIIISVYMYSINNNLFIFLIPAIYLTLNIIYSRGLKNKPIIDVVILVSGFVLRVMYGGLVTNIPVSKWLYLMIIFGAFYLGFGKRRNEIIKNGKASRKVLEYYNKEFLDKNMYVCLTLAIISYTLWCVDAETISRIGNPNLFWTIPLVMIIFLIYSLNIETDSHADPVEVVLSDKPLLFSIITYGIVMIYLLYFN